MIIDFVGKFYDNHSLSIINRNLVIQLTTIYPDWEISITPLDSYDPEYKLDKNVVKQLKILERTHLYYIIKIFDLDFLLFIEINQIIIHLFFFIPTFFNKFISAFGINKVQFNLNIGV